MSEPAAWITPHWDVQPNVRAIVTTRDGAAWERNSPHGFNVGSRCGDDPAAVARNRGFLSDALSLPSEPRWLRQVHATSVATFDGLHRPSTSGDAPARGRAPDSVRPAAAEPEADAAVTRTPGVVLAIQTADCLPVLFCARDGSEIAAAHAGWRGLSAGVLEATLAAMRTPRENILAWLGPAIAPASYEVGGEVRQAFLAHDRAAAAAFVATRPGHWQCDLYGLARQRLRASQVTRISGGGFDTFSDRRLHSFRRDGDRSGRMASLVWMQTAVRPEA